MRALTPAREPQRDHWSRFSRTRIQPSHLNPAPSHPHPVRRGRTGSRSTAGRPAPGSLAPCRPTSALNTLVGAGVGLFRKRSRVFKGIPTLRKCYHACRTRYRCETGGIPVKTDPVAAPRPPGRRESHWGKCPHWGRSSICPNASFPTPMRDTTHHSHHRRVTTPPAHPDKPRLRESVGDRSKHHPHERGHARPLRIKSSHRPAPHLVSEPKRRGAPGAAPPARTSHRRRR